MRPLLLAMSLLLFPAILQAGVTRLQIDRREVVVVSEKSERVESIEVASVLG